MYYLNFTMDILLNFNQHLYFTIKLIKYNRYVLLRNKFIIYLSTITTSFVVLYCVSVQYPLGHSYFHLFEYIMIVWMPKDFFYLPTNFFFSIFIPSIYIKSSPHTHPMSSRSLKVFHWHLTQETIPIYDLILMQS